MHNHARSDSSITRTCTCACGALRVETSGEPMRVYLCFCHDCQKLSGTAFAYRAMFQLSQVNIIGRYTVWRRAGRSGGRLAFGFCPDCGSTLFTWPEGRKDLLAISIGGFNDASFRPPDKAYWTARKHGWLALPPDVETCEEQ